MAVKLPSNYPTWTKESLRLYAAQHFSVEISGSKPELIKQLKNLAENFTPGTPEPEPEVAETQVVEGLTGGATEAVKTPEPENVPGVEDTEVVRAGPTKLGVHSKNTRWLYNSATDMVMRPSPELRKRTDLVAVTPEFAQRIYNKHKLGPIDG